MAGDWNMSLGAEREEPGKTRREDIWNLKLRKQGQDSKARDAI